MADGVVHTGSSVVEMQGFQTHGNIDGDLSGVNARGQATIVDLGRGRFLFALLRVCLPGAVLDPVERENRFWGDYPSISDIFGTYRDIAEYRADHRTREQKIKEKILPLKERGPVQLAPWELPDLLTFADINDPKSAVQVSPSHMDRVFGPGVRLVSATLEITSDPVTTGISKVIPWVTDPRSSGGTCKAVDLCLDLSSLASDVK
jgi:hypothetical protein